MIQDKVLSKLGRNRLTRKCILGTTQIIQAIESLERQSKTTHNEIYQKIQGTHQEGGHHRSQHHLPIRSRVNTKRIQKDSNAKPERLRRMV